MDWLLRDLWWSWSLSDGWMCQEGKTRPFACFKLGDILIAMRMCTYTTINHKQLLWCCLWASKTVNSGRLTFDLIKSHEIHFSTVFPVISRWCYFCRRPICHQSSNSLEVPRSKVAAPSWVYGGFPNGCDDFWYIWYILIYIWWYLDEFHDFGWFWWFGIVCNVWLRVYPYWLPICSRQLCPTTRQKTRQTVGCPGNKMWEWEWVAHWNALNLSALLCRWQVGLLWCRASMRNSEQLPDRHRTSRRGDAWCIEPKDGYLLAKQRSGSQLSVLYRVHAVATIAAPWLWP